MSKNILITNFEIKQYSGSEINASTIAKRFKQLGYTVYIAALDFGNPLLDNVKEESFDVLINLLDGDFDFTSIEFDILWAHHSFMLDWLIFDKKVKSKKIINSSLSPVEVFEVPPIYANEISMSIANSQETEEKLKSYGITNTYLLENYSFESYFKQKIEVKELKKIAVVSNHVPDEIFDVIKKLEQNNYQVQIYGIQGKQEYITDEILKEYDVIITIGKTVQYAMSLKIPVYIYDRFGGPGYLTMANIELNRAHNFSGRGYFKKDAETIYQEIVQGFEEELNQLESIKQYAQNNFCFERKIDDVIQKLSEKEDVNLEEIENKYNKYIRNMIASKKVAEYLQRRNEKLRKEEKDILYKRITELENVEKENLELKQTVERQKKEIEGIKDSRTWKYVEKIRKILKGH